MTPASFRSRSAAALSAAIILASCTDSEQASGLLPVTTTDAIGLQGAEICDAGDEAFVRHAMLNLVGRWPHSVREIAVMVDAVKAIGREVWVDRMMATPEFIDTWEQALRDALFVPRSGPAAVAGCRGAPLLPDDHGALATFLRDHGPLDTYAPGGTAVSWNTGDAYRSAIQLDDLSMLFRVEPFLRDGCLTFELEDINDELSNRRTSAQIFERAFMNRRFDCMGCHNSEFSTTGDPDPAKDRTWEIRGLFEKAVFGDSTGGDPTRFEALFRVDGVKSFRFVADAPNKQFWKNGPGFSPWGLAKACGQFKLPDQITVDKGKQDGFFVRHFGLTASLYDLEGVLREGFQNLRQKGLVVADNGEVEGTLAAAWLVSAAFSERVFEQIIGARLTVAHSFSRNRAQHDLLESLARTFVSTGFSLKAVVRAVILHPLFNEAAPADCGHDTDPYGLPPILNPWTPAEEDPARRQNGAGDAVVRIPPVALLRSVASALEWTVPDVVYEYDNSASLEGYKAPEASLLLRELGSFMGEMQVGFRGANFQEALAWEYVIGQCRDPFRTDGATNVPDWLTGVVSGAPTVEAAIVALKDRLLNTPDVSDREERTLLEALIGAPLGAPAAGHEDGIRLACVAFLRSPDLGLQGIPRRIDPGEAERTTAGYVPSGAALRDFCATWQPRFEADGATCSEAGRLRFPTK